MEKKIKLFRRLSEEIKAITLTAEQQADGLINIKHGKYVLVPGIPDPAISDMVLAGFMTVMANAAVKIDGYISAMEHEANRLMNDLFTFAKDEPV
jgi:hypothetical protein